jgi:hypothetical protein
VTSVAMRSTETPGSFCAAGVTYQKAGPDDDRAIRDLLRSNDMDSWARMSIEREPSFFHGENLIGPSLAVIARKSDPPQQVVGMYAMAEQRTHVNGAPADTAYLAALRVDPEYRHKLRVLKNGFASARALTRIDGLTVFTSLASENLAARRLLEANLRGMPCYTPVGDVASMGFSTRQGKPGGLLQSAVPEDIPALVEFYNAAAASYQFTPVLSRQWLTHLTGSSGLRLGDFWLLKDGADVRGCIAIWDQRSFKQIVARGYRFPLNLLRGGYNLHARLTGRLVLPRPGKELEQVFLSFLTLDTQASNDAEEVIREALMIARRKGARVGTLGLSVQNPLVSCLRESLHASIYRTRIETIHWPDSVAPVLDGRAPQPEVGLL